MRIKKGGLSWKDDPGAANAKMREILDRMECSKDGVDAYYGQK